MTNPEGNGLYFYYIFINFIETFFLFYKMCKYSKNNQC